LHFDAGGWRDNAKPRPERSTADILTTAPLGADDERQAQALPIPPRSRT
jgi:hypothetical protein